ncbi:PACE efflux transporter [Methylobacillus arboreus]|uniref:PACE efflux transporter n=1 Tax=Methylobacillus arboreus TaxID=755170 RepID=UPI001E5E1744|nr:PACE efflux transporter [Methylobacillus arboreus]MCB5191184.1 PACE efflux transporter [Methylobacillus arboreus]
MQGIKRKLVYVTLYEAFAMLFTSVGLALFSGQSLAHAGVAGVASSTVAFIWNLIYNTGFEAWEAKQPGTGRSVGRRLLHAAGFEAGLVLTLVPLFAWWLQVSLWEALWMDIGLIIFFLVYTYLFNLLFDHVFGLPASAQANTGQHPEGCKA